jgi:hypothetical protein
MWSKLLRSLVIAGLAYSAIAACNKKPSEDEVAASSQAALDSEMQPAFVAAFGQPSPAPHAVRRAGQDEPVQFEPKMLIDLGGGRLALISKGAAPEGGGAIALHYLTQAGDTFTMTGQWFDLLPQSGASQGVPDIRLRKGLFAQPALEIEAADRKMGCDVAAAGLYELLPAGPALRARDIVTERNNIPMGAMRTGPQIDYYGNVIVDNTGHTFKVHYHGSFEQDVTWAPGAGGLWAPTGVVKLPEC